MKQDEARIERIYALFDEYAQAYAAEWQRLERCERLYMGEHWHDVPQSDTREPRPVTPVLQSTIENIRADLMDQMPEAIITADDPANERAAQALTEILGENHRRCHYENEYAKLLHDLLIGGYMVQETGFDPHADGGLGGLFCAMRMRTTLWWTPCARIYRIPARCSSSPRTPRNGSKAAIPMITIS